MARLLLAISTLLLFAPVARSVSAADAPGEALPRRVSGTLLWRTVGEGALVPAPALDTHVHLRVTGMVARAAVRQEFGNPAAEWAEGVYVFPLPEDAAVDHLRMRVGERVVEGQIRERVAARAEYEQARQQGRRASLVDQERSNVFDARTAVLAGADNTAGMVLLTCYPFDAVRPGGPLRYLVLADADGG